MTLRVLLVPEAFPPSRGGVAGSADRIVGYLRQAGVEVWAVDLDARGEFSPGLSVTIDESRETTILATPFFDNERPVRIPERAKAAARREAALQLATVARSLGIDQCDCAASTMSALDDAGSSDAPART